MTRSSTRASAAAARPRASLRHALGVLWRFARPHTVIGTWSGIVGIYAIAAAELDAMALGDALDHLAWTLLAGLCVNVAIVGVNQITDVEIDRLNKPTLPIAAGELSPAAARRVVAAASGVALVLALSQGAVETLAVAATLAIGLAYSVPPLRLKRFPVLAALSIASVRALVVNLGVYLHFSGALADDSTLAAVPASIWALTAFVLPFGIAIALLKDVPDVEGDRRFGIATFSVRLGGRRVLRLGLAALTLAYLGMAVAGPALVDDANPIVLVGGHGLALAALWRWAAAVQVARPGDVTRFYMRVWRLFFLEYLLVAAAVLAR